jgi:hypothetical protein
VHPPGAVLRECRIALAVRFERGPPGRLQRLPALADAGLEMLTYPVGHQEHGVFWPAVMPFGQADLVLAQWFAMRRTGVLLVGRAVGDMAVDNDQGGPILSRSSFKSNPP